MYVGKFVVFIARKRAIQPFPSKRKPGTRGVRRAPRAPRAPRGSRAPLGKVHRRGTRARQSRTRGHGRHQDLDGNLLKNGDGMY